MDNIEREDYEKTISEQNKKIIDLEKTISTLVCLYKDLQEKAKYNNNLYFPEIINTGPFANQNHFYTDIDSTKIPIIYIHNDSKTTN